MAKLSRFFNLGLQWTWKTMCKGCGFPLMCPLSHRYLQSTASRSGQRFIIWTPLRQKNALFILFEQLEWKAHFLPKLFVGIEGLLWSMRFSLDLLGLWRAHLCYLADVPSIKASHKKNFCPKRHPGVLGRKKIANYFYFKTLAIGNDVFDGWKSLNWPN